GELDAALDYRYSTSGYSTLEYSAAGLDGALRLRATGVEVAGADDPALGLAFALLDAPGADAAAAEIHAGFRGRSDDDLRDLIGTALRARLESVAAAPFDVLGRAAGMEGSQLESV